MATEMCGQTTLLPPSLKNILFQLEYNTDLSGKISEALLVSIYTCVFRMYGFEN